jgi:hypothetical protein
VARYGDGWKPFLAPRGLAATAKTVALEGPDDLRVLLDELWAEVETAGRDRSAVDVSFVAGAGGTPGTDGFEPEMKLEAVSELGGLGVTWVDVGVPGASLDQALEGLAEFGETVIGTHGG